MNRQMTNLKKGFRALLAEAEAAIRSLATAELVPWLADPNTAFIDLREPDELAEHGRIPGSISTPRGELEFYADPECPLHRPIFASGKRLVLYCAGGWRSALAARTLQDMGIANVVHLRDGFDAWKAAGAPVESTRVAAPASAQAPRATGIGGIFFKAKDPKALAAWYQQHLGLEVEHGSIVTFHWREQHQPQGLAYTVWSAFADTTKYFEPSNASFMINYRVAGLDQLLDALRCNGVTVDERVEVYDYGRFAWIMDPEGNRIELWEPTDIKPH
jgi:rhodanese-related sulfurtransferase/predicted enzyme related to lactoylglutathione lyase